MPAALSTNGLVMPPDFPVDAYEAIHARLLAAKVNTQGHQYKNYSGAWNAISYRFLAATHDSEHFTSSIARYGGAPNPEIRYQQERALFGFFTNGLSSLEATFYGLFAIAGYLNPTTFLLNTDKEQQAVSPASTRAAFGKAFPATPLIAVLDSILSDASYVELKDIRNILAHRVAPGRQIYATVGDSKPLPEEWKLRNIPLDEKMTPTRLGELARLLRTLLEGARVFVEAYF